MTEKQQLEQQLWKIADTLRGKMGADEFRDYILASSSTNTSPSESTSSPIRSSSTMGSSSTKSTRPARRGRKCSPPSRRNRGALRGSQSRLVQAWNQKNELLAKVLVQLDQIDFRLDDTEADVLGDAFEYLIGQFASGAARKRASFTPRRRSAPFSPRSSPPERPA